MQTLPATPFPFEVFDGVTYIQLVAVKACTLQGLIQNLPGWPDLLLWRPGRVVAAELKSEVGKPTDEQVAVLASLGVAFIVTPWAAVRLLRRHDLLYRSRC